MRKSWEMKKLGDVCTDLLQGINTATDKTEFVNNGVPIFQAKEIGIDKLELSNCKFITVDKYKIAAERYKPKPGDILYNNIGSSMGRSIEVVWDYPFTIAWNVMRIIPDKNKISPKFLNYLLQSPIVFDKIIFKSKGVGMPFISKKDLVQIEAYYPPLPEQQRIVSILDEAFAAIATAKANAEQNLKNAKELFESYLQGVFENKGEGWEEKTLGEVLVKTESIDPTRRPNEEFIYLDVSSVNKETKEIEGATTLLGKDAPSRARKLVKVNDVIFATVRPTHSRVALITEEYDGQVCSTGYFVIRTKDLLNSKIAYYFLLTSGFNKQMEKLQKGASYPAVTDSDVKGICISFPKSIEIQHALAQKLDSLSEETKRLEAIYQQKITDLEELKKTILQKAFNGELKISEPLIAAD
jgi:type I restriction enzyme S subunit